MSDEVKEDKDKKDGDKGGEKRQRPTDRDKAVVEPVIKDRRLFDFLEMLFYAEPEVAHFPERVEIRIVTGRYREKMGEIINSFSFAPMNASTEAAKKSGAQGKPSKEKLVHMSNQILCWMQEDCNEQHAKTSYAVNAWHFSRGDRPYARFLKTCEPQDVEADEPKSIEEQFSGKILDHHERLFEMYRDSLAGVLDRMDRNATRDAAVIDKLQATVARQSEAMERALSMEAERKREADWQELKIDAARRGMRFVETVGTPLLSRLAGAKASASADVVVLKNFFKMKEEGGLLTNEMANAVFGEFDNVTGEVTRPGVLTVPQGEILLQVAREQLPPDALDRLMPGAEHAITMEQVMALQQILSMEQLAPLMLIFQSRQGKKS